MSDCITVHVGLDVHKESIEIATADASGGEVRHVGRVGRDLPALDAALARLRCPIGGLQVVYEAGPCGYAIYRHLTARGIACAVVAPSLTPRRPGERIKTDRRDALKLARLSRAGELRAIRVPEAEDEAIRDLLRARDDSVRTQRDARHRLKALLRRQDVRYTGKTAWTPAQNAGWPGCTCRHRPSRWCSRNTWTACTRPRCVSAAWIRRSTRCCRRGHAIRWSGNCRPCAGCSNCTSPCW